MGQHDYVCVELGLLHLLDAQPSFEQPRSHWAGLERSWRSQLTTASNSEVGVVNSDIR